MKIYVAAKFEKKELVLEIYDRLKEVGHEIAYDWTTHKNIQPYNENKELASEYAQNEMKGIQECDVFILLIDENGVTQNMEFGAALASNTVRGIPKVYVIGECNSKSPWFFSPNVIRKESFEDVLEELNL